MAEWWRFWSVDAWKEWWIRRQPWKEYRSEGRRLDRSISQHESSLSANNTELRRVNQQISWASEVHPQDLPVKLAKAEIGLASVSAVALLETRRREGRDVWVPVDQGNVYLTDRQAVFSGSKEVRFRYDKLVSQEMTASGLFLAVSNRKRTHTLSGPSDNISALLTACVAVSTGQAATSPFTAKAEDLAVTVAGIEATLDEERAERASLVVPPRPVSPAWIPGVLLVVLLFGVTAMGSPATSGPVAVAGTSTTTTVQPVATSTSLRATTTSIPLPTTTTLPPIPQSEILFAPMGFGPSGDPTAPLSADAEVVTVMSITDGDTIDVRFADGTTETVRLIGINTPESGECWAEEASLVLTTLIPVDGEIGMTVDVSDRDQYDRLLRYLWVGSASVNEEMVRRGAAISRRYAPDTSLASRFEAAQAEAQATALGLWAPDACGPPSDALLFISSLVADAEGDDNQNLNGEYLSIHNAGHNLVDLTGWGIKDESSSHRYTFPDGFSLGPDETVTVYSGCGDDFGTSLYWCSVGSAIWNNDGDTAFLTDPSGNTHTSLAYTPPTTTTSSTTTTTSATSGGGGNCDPSYPTVCIPPPPPDLDCGDISFRKFKVVGSDPHRFDGDHDGIGCESG